ncbi:sperm microtubule associated protein 2-like isoform X2 [Babylonia areolata]|uniref:sperm microtubule associated protein 2-like isoform X2 n=1 Tax=Babylonia areolata TaxID=304850 RepID=UPI003FCF4909
MTVGQSEDIRLTKSDLEASRKCIELLARPKEPKIGWNTCLRPQVRWGTQEPMYPLSAGAMHGHATPRIQELATPKRNFQAGQEGRRLYYLGMGRPSMIWSVSEAAKHAPSSGRLELLAKPKRYHPGYSEQKNQFYYSCGRESPIWRSRSGSGEERPRIAELARPREYHPDFQGERPIQSFVTPAAKSASANYRISSLAEPRKRSNGQFQDPEWHVSNAAKSSSPSPRCLEMAKEKPLPEAFKLARDIMWPVSNAAKHAHASPRLEELSQPVNRASMDNVQFNTQAFIVKESALKGVIPARIKELAEPIMR